MKTLQKKASLLGIGALLVGAGALVGVLASELTSDALVWRSPPRIPATEVAIATMVDQASAGQRWARTAFDGGLRQCPKMNAEFLTACEAEMKKLAERPAFPAASYGGPLLITKVETASDDEAWDAQERLELPRPAPVPADYELPQAPPAFERTPDNYPAAAVDEGVAIADVSPPSIPR